MASRTKTQKSNRIKRRGIAALVATAVAASALAATAFAAVPLTGTFRGDTSQKPQEGHQPSVTISVVHRGHRVSKLLIDWWAACDNGKPNLLQTTQTSGPLPPSGSFHGKATYPSTTGNLKGTPYEATITDDLRGRFVSPTRATGTFKATAVVKDAEGQVVSTCKTPVVHWRASRG